MELALMRYKGFNFRVNPLSVEITGSDSQSKYTLPFNGEILISKGMGCRVVKGKGELKGKDCIERYAELRALQMKGGEGVLSPPGLMPFKAFFTKLVAEADVTPDRICYSFEFTEASSVPVDSLPHGHTVKEGETLYDIAFDYGIKLENLVELNSQIKRPDELKKGEKVRLC